MQHLLDQVRPPIDDFEVALINAYSTLKSVQAIWVREVRDVAAKKGPSGVPKRFTRAVWLQLTHRSLGDFRAMESLTNELQVRALSQPFELEVRWIVDDLPPAAVAPSCIFRRGSGRV